MRHKNIATNSLNSWIPLWDVIMDPVGIENDARRACSENEIVHQISEEQVNTLVPLGRFGIVHHILRTCFRLKQSCYQKLEYDIL